MRARVLALALAFAWVAVVRADHLEVQRSVTLKADPNRDAEIVTTLAPDTFLALLSSQQQNGYYHARINETGEEGWVYRTFVRRNPGNAPANAALGGGGSTPPPTAAGVSACPGVEDLEDCPDDGCAVPGTEHALLNRVKRNRNPSGPLVPLTFRHFARLQQIANDLNIEVGKGSHLTEQDRATLTGLLVDGLSVGEGNLVQLVGFIAEERTLRASGGESVNCKLTGTANNDVHVPLVENEEGSEYQSVVVEPVPQDRPAAWTVAKLNQLRRDRIRIKVQGQLFFDNQHRVRDDPDDEEGLTSEPKRFTLWEIHPVTRIFECTLPNNACSANGSNGWRELQ